MELSEEDKLFLSKVAEEAAQNPKSQTPRPKSPK